MTLFDLLLVSLHEVFAGNRILSSEICLVNETLPFNVYIYQFYRDGHEIRITFNIHRAGQAVAQRRLWQQD